MPKYRVAVRDRATIDVIAWTEVEAETPEAAIAVLENASWEDPRYELDFQPDEGLGWFDRHMEPEYKVYDEDGAPVAKERRY